MPLTNERKKEIVDAVTAPGSPIRQVADWHRRDGADPPPVVVEAVAAKRAATKRLLKERQKKKD